MSKIRIIPFLTDEYIQKGDYLFPPTIDINFDGNFSEMTLQYIKNQQIIINDDILTNNQKNLYQKFTKSILKKKRITIKQSIIQFCIKMQTYIIIYI